MFHLFFLKDVYVVLSITIGLAKIYDRPKIGKTPPTKIGPFSNTFT